MQSYRDLQVWNRAMVLVEQIYAVTALFPTAEQFGLSGQLRRAAVSIASNIAEGSGRGSDRSYIYYLRIARGSEAELQTQMELAIRLRFISSTQAAPAIASATEVGKMLNGLINALLRKSGTLGFTPDN